MIKVVKTVSEKYAHLFSFKYKQTIKESLVKETIENKNINNYVLGFEWVYEYFKQIS